MAKQFAQKMFSLNGRLLSIANSNVNNVFCKAHFKLNKTSFINGVNQKRFFTCNFKFKQDKLDLGASNVCIRRSHNSSETVDKENRTILESKENSDKLLTDYGDETPTSLEVWNENSTSDLLSDIDSLPADPNELQELENLPPPRPIEPSYTFAPLVTQSESLQRLVKLGVDLSILEKVPEAANFVVQANWDTDIQPKLLFLRDVGVMDEDLGLVLNKNPLLFKESIEDMQVCIDYFQSKKFDSDQICRIVAKAPLTLSMPVITIDKKLGFLQSSFRLNGDEVRLVATKFPKIIPWKLQKLKDIRFYIKEMLGFSENELKSMLLKAPKIYLSDKNHLATRFDFLHNTMGFSHKALSDWPNVFRSRLHILKDRHRFLLLLGRAQYDPTKENFVPLKALVSGRDKDFCSNVAKTSTAQFYNFLKSV